MAVVMSMNAKWEVEAVSLDVRTLMVVSAVAVQEDFTGLALGKNGIDQIKKKSFHYTRLSSC